MAGRVRRLARSLLDGEKTFRAGPLPIDDEDRAHQFLGTLGDQAVGPINVRSVRGDA
jgi:hypothetical protein